MKKKHLIMVILSPLLLIGTLLIAPFFLLHWLIDDRSMKINLRLAKT